MRRNGKTLTAILVTVAVAAFACMGVAALASAAKPAVHAALNCVPAVLNRSDVLPGTPIQVSPLPDSADASPRTQISLLGAPVSSLSHISVKGSETGTHAGRVVPYSQGDGASFMPTKPFVPDEEVTVRGEILQGTVSSHFAFHFSVADPDTIAPDGSVAKTASSTDAAGAHSARVITSAIQTFHSRPDLQPPAVKVTADSSATAPGYVFAAPYAGPGEHGPMIFDDSGQLVWFKVLPKGTEAANLQVQTYQGQPVLTWWQGKIPPQGFGEGAEVIYSSSYLPIRTVYAGNGYQADLHDFHISANDTGLLTVFNPIRCNLRSIGGPANAAVTDGVFEEIDLKTGAVRREWHSLDHVSLNDSYASPAHSTLNSPFDYFHINSLDVEQNGSLLISSRNTWALYVLDSETGQVTSEIGGRHSSVTMAPGSSPAWQHDATQLPDGTISIFDNGGVPKVHSQSRALVIAVNAVAKHASVVRQYTYPGTLSAGSQGSVQSLSNGDAFVGWGAEPYFSEFSGDGKVLFAAQLPPGDQSYRGYRFAWTGTPQTTPVAAALPASGGALTVYASWNGSTVVASWRVLAGSSAGQLSPVASSPRTAFETAIKTTSRGPYVEVEALNAAGALLGTTPVMKG